MQCRFSILLQQKRLKKLKKNFTHRLATIDDLDAIQNLMMLSINSLISPMTNKDELEAHFDGMGLDEQLIKDNTYVLVFRKNILVGCGGWGIRRTLFGGSHTKNRNDNFLNPKKESARIRAMYTHPDYTRIGIGSFILKFAEEKAKKLGFNKIELMATFSGKPLYESRNYRFLEESIFTSSLGNKVIFYKMEKDI